MSGTVLYEFCTEARIPDLSTEVHIRKIKGDYEILKNLLRKMLQNTE